MPENNLFISEFISDKIDSSSSSLPRHNEIEGSTAFRDSVNGPVVTERSEVTIKGLRVSKMLDPTIEVTLLTSLPLQVICRKENATISNQMRGHTHATPILNDGHL